MIKQSQFNVLHSVGCRVIQNEETRAVPGLQSQNKRTRGNQKKLRTYLHIWLRLSKKETDDSVLSQEIIQLEIIPDDFEFEKMCRKELFLDFKVNQKD